MITTLGNARFQEPKAQATRHLLIAATSFSLYLESGRKEESLLRTARAEIANCRRLDAAVRPDPKWFSPAFTQLFGSVR